MRAAIAAVEAAERQLQQEQQAEEARLIEERQELKRRELQRLGRISIHFDNLRCVLNDVRLRQKGAIEGRHKQASEDNRLMEANLEKTQRQKAENILGEKNEVIARHKTMIKDLQRKHAASLVQTIKRHRSDQDALLAAHTEAEDEDTNLVKAAVLEKLMPAQEDERQTLKMQQAREIQKWRTRGEQEVQRFGSDMRISRMRLEEVGKVAERSREFQKLEYAEWKWFEIISAERTSMLGDDERRMIESGGDVPAAVKEEQREDMRTTWHHSFVKIPGAVS